MELIHSKGCFTYFLHTSHIIYINVSFYTTVFGLYWRNNFATKGNRAKGVKPLFSHQDFVQLLLPIRKNKFKKDFGYFE